jgi:hypothetical protein
MDAESLYVQLGRLVETMPDLSQGGITPPETKLWLGRAYAFIKLLGDVPLEVAFDKALTKREEWRVLGAEEIAFVLYRALAMAELRAPAAAQGAFIPAGNAFDALAAISKTLSGATSDVLIVDPFMSEKTLTDFVPLAPEGVTVRLLTDQNSRKPTFDAAVERWKSQYGSKRPLAARLTAVRALHDRVIIADSRQVWILTQSLKDFAARSPASIVRADGEAAALKVSAYQRIWDSATPL